MKECKILALLQIQQQETQEWGRAKVATSEPPHSTNIHGGGMPKNHTPPPPPKAHHEGETHSEPAANASRQAASHHAHQAPLQVQPPPSHPQQATPAPSEESTEATSPALFTSSRETASEHRRHSSAKKWKEQNYSRQHTEALQAPPLAEAPPPKQQKSRSREPVPHPQAGVEHEPPPGHPTLHAAQARHPHTPAQQPQGQQQVPEVSHRP
ncbi:fibrous sheath CABYR-binding protein-like [Procambarus clarkii]|uniref:fibrous sheath CABYR-binding protein-like n=1 Tax=Procambarus clarkii TaxID=6728 RepID=UPI00374492B8